MLSPNLSWFPLHPQCLLRPNAPKARVSPAQVRTYDRHHSATPSTSSPYSSVFSRPWLRICEPAEFAFCHPFSLAPSKGVLFASPSDKNITFLNEGLDLIGPELTHRPNPYPWDNTFVPVDAFNHIQPSSRGAFFSFFHQNVSLQLQPVPDSEEETDLVRKGSKPNLPPVQYKARFISPSTCIRSAPYF